MSSEIFFLLLPSLSIDTLLKMNLLNEAEDSIPVAFSVVNFFDCFLYRSRIIQGC